jgi:hypothetical protein
MNASYFDVAPVGAGAKMRLRARCRAASADS